ncbi:MAG: biopolymer transporter ExbD [Xylophilus ampelinus]
MNFHRSTGLSFAPRPDADPEINLIPFIDVLLVVVIFLMLSTTYSRFTELQLQLPVADAQAQRPHARELVVGVASDGRYLVGKTLLQDGSVDALQQAIGRDAPAGPDTVLIISADAAAPHQSVISVMEAARRAGVVHITFATQSSAAARAAGR